MEPLAVLLAKATLYEAQAEALLVKALALRARMRATATDAPASLMAETAVDAFHGGACAHPTAGLVVSRALNRPDEHICTACGEIRAIA